QSDGSAEVEQLKPVAAVERVDYGEHNAKRRSGESPWRCVQKRRWRPAARNAKGSRGICRIASGRGRTGSAESELVIHAGGNDACRCRSVPWRKSWPSE